MKEEMADFGSITEGNTPTASTTLDKPKNQSQKCIANVVDNFRSPTKKLRLEIPNGSQNAANGKEKRNEAKDKYIYGNYNRYYGYRCGQRAEDIRLDAFKNHCKLFDSKEILDIGCNDGSVTIAIAKRFPVTFITGFDIDRNLIAMARKQITNEMHGIMNNNDKTIPADTKFPQNIAFKCCNYVLSDDRLLELEEPRFDTILCLSVTKWIHLNFGDDGLKRTFKRMFRQLKPGGTLILEAQHWKGYKRRKNLTTDIHTNYTHIKFFPNQFNEYLLSADVGFSSVSNIELPTQHPANGFKRPIFAFAKP